MVLNLRSFDEFLDETTLSNIDGAGLGAKMATSMVQIIGELMVYRMVM